jgi:hypothetical protein
LLSRCLELSSTLSPSMVSPTLSVSTAVLLSCCVLSRHRSTHRLAVLRSPRDSTDR